MIQYDKRGSPRVFQQVAVTFSVIDGHAISRKVAPARDNTIDISESGMRLTDAEGVPAGAMLEIFIEPPDAVSPIVHFGRARWCVPAADRTGFEIGVELLDASPGDRGAWLAYVRRRINFATAA